MVPKKILAKFFLTSVLDLIRESLIEVFSITKIQGANSKLVQIAINKPTEKIKVMDKLKLATTGENILEISKAKKIGPKKPATKNIIITKDNKNSFPISGLVLNHVSFLLSLLPVIKKPTAGAMIPETIP
ncbi:MAG: hypothetical protein WAO29_05050 [Candidatus Nanopelagicales bacterium]